MQSFGKNADGQLGLGNIDSTGGPTQISLPSSSVGLILATGLSHSMVYLIQEPTATTGSGSIEFSEDSKDEVSSQNESESGRSVGLIALIIILSSFLPSILIFSILFWYFRKRKMNSREHDNKDNMVELKCTTIKPNQVTLVRKLGLILQVISHISRFWKFRRSSFGRMEWNRMCCENEQRRYSGSSTSEGLGNHV